jgi:hypothetical protein
MFVGSDFSVIRRVEYGRFSMPLFIFRDALGASGPVVREWFLFRHSGAMRSIEPGILPYKLEIPGSR